FARGNETHDVQLGLELGDRSKYAEYRRSAAHVVLHLVHVGRRLDRDAAAVECNALADEHERPLLPHRVVVLHDDEARRLFTTIRDRQERSHAQVLDLLALEDPYFDIGEFASELEGPIGQVARRADVAGQIAEIASEIHTVGDR